MAGPLQVPDCCIAILLGLVFCLIQPLMTPIALSYFLINSILYKYQLIYVHKPQFESGGMVKALIPHLLLRGHPIWMPVKEI